MGSYECQGEMQSKKLTTNAFIDDKQEKPSAY